MAVHDCTETHEADAGSLQGTFKDSNWPEGGGKDHAIIPLRFEDTVKYIHMFMTGGLESERSIGRLAMISSYASIQYS